MIDIKLLREQPELIQQGLDRRHGQVDLAPLLKLDAQRRTLLHEVEQLRAEQNRTSTEIAARKKRGEDASEMLARMKAVSDQGKGIEEQIRGIDDELQVLLLTLPNLPHESLPDGADSADNRRVRQWGTPRQFDFPVKDHVDLGEGLGILDFERGAKLAGARFCLSRGAGAQLERALINFMLDIHTREHGYTEVLPPFMVNSMSMQGTGQLPKFAEDSFHIENTDYWMIPTAEVPVTNIFRDEILPADQLPIHYVAYTPCWRSEAGSYGKDTRGMIRQHQFNKVELVKFVDPETSWEELERLTQHAETILQRLELPYQVMELCTGDLGFSAAKTYDLEVWLPGQQAYREISSCSNFGDFQARRANIRFKRDKKPAFVHTLNGSGLAVGRTLVAILENYQEEDGSITVPKAIQPYLNGQTAITR